MPSFIADNQREHDMQKSLQVLFLKWAVSKQLQYYSNRTLDFSFFRDSNESMKERKKGTKANVLSVPGRQSTDNWDSI